MSKVIEGIIECPFYLREGERFISCEGILVDSAVTTHRFKSDEDKRSYQYCYCSVNGGKKCRHYRNLMVLYERGEKT